MRRDGSLARLRSQVLERALAVTAIGMPTISGLIVLGALRRGALTELNLWLSISTLAFPILWGARRSLSFYWRGFLLLVLIGSAALIVQLRGGLVMSTAVLQLLMIVLGGLLFGRRGAALSLLGTVVCFSFAAWMVVSAHVAPIPLHMWNPENVLAWVRSGIVLVLFGGCSVLAIVYMVERLEAEARTLSETLAREQSERLARAAAEAERERAQHALADAHRLEALGRLAGGVAHDFNNTLTVIVGATQIALLDSKLSAEVRSSLNDIDDAARRAAQLTHELLMLGRKDVETSRVVNLAHLLPRLRSTLSRVLPSDVELQIGNVEGCVAIEPLRLERILLNLVVNARDAITGPGTIELGCEVQERAAPAGKASAECVALWVKDNGAGMDESTQLRLFEPFYTTKGVGHGTGLGMTLVQRFVLDAGGDVQVASQTGIGTKVTLFLPKAAWEAIARVDSEPAPAELSSALRGKRILVVEDQAEVRSMITRCLERAGFAVVQAADGDEALRILEDPTVHVDLLCVDGVIPGASSAQVIECSRSLRPGTGILVCSGYVDEELLVRGIRAGELACVRKPFTPLELIKGVRAQLKASVSSA